MITQPPGTHLAQLNVARARFVLDDPRIAEFMDALDRVNTLAERSPGFVWRLKDGSGNATDIAVSDDPQLIANLSVWETPEQLEHFVWNTVHKQFYRKKGNWFAPMSTPHFVMWWISGRVPTSRRRWSDDHWQRTGQRSTPSAGELADISLMQHAR